MAKGQLELFLITNYYYSVYKRSFPAFKTSASQYSLKMRSLLLSRLKCTSPRRGGEGGYIFNEYHILYMTSYFIRIFQLLIIC